MAWPRGFDTERRSHGRLEELLRNSDPIAARHRKYVEEILDRVLGARVFGISIRVVADRADEGMLVARSLGRSISGGATFEAREISIGIEEHQHALDRLHSFEPEPMGSNGGGGTGFSTRLIRDSLKSLRRKDARRVQRLTVLARFKSLGDAATVQAALRMPTSEGVLLKTIRTESEWDPKRCRRAR